MAVLDCPPHKWGPTERIDQPMASMVRPPHKPSWWHWCRCTLCGAPGFKVEYADGTQSKATRCWQPCDTVVIEARP